MRGAIDPIYGRRSLERRCRIVVGAVIAILVSGQLIFAWTNGNNVSPIADPFSEANAIRAGEGYVAKGFTTDAGLPDISYGTQFSMHGRYDVGGFIYTRYPPGPDWIAGLVTKLFGTGHIILYRVIPITVGLVCIIFFAWALMKALGAAQGTILFLACAVVPMFSNMMHGLHYQGYAFHLLLLELGLLLLYFSQPVSRSLLKWNLAFFIIGFVQGWLSFDYCFLVTFAPVPYAVLSRGLTLGDRLRRLLAAVLALGLGFSLAHMLHFTQVVLYYDDFNKAVEDLGQSARLRSGYHGQIRWWLHLSAVWTYLRSEVYRGMYFWTLFNLTFIVPASFFILKRGMIVLPFAPLNLHAVWSMSRWKLMFVPVLALIVSAAWVFVMPGHAMSHLHFIPRHFFLFYFFCLLTVLHSMRVYARRSWR